MERSFIFLATITSALLIGVISGNDDTASSSAYMQIDKGLYLPAAEKVIASIFVVSPDVCSLKCIRESSCRSLNVAIDKNGNGLVLCDMLSTSKYEHSTQLQPNKNFHHYTVVSRLLYYNFLTPTKLLELATYKPQSYSVTDKELSIKSTRDSGLLLRIPLVKQGVLSPGTSLTVKIVVAQNTTIGNTEDSDIGYGISDGRNFMGMQTTDSFYRGYKAYPPCYRREGTSGLTLTVLKYKSQVNTDTKNAKYPDQFEITLKPSQRWGSCYIAYGSGNTRQETYQGQLSLDRGLSLEVYSNNVGERYGIKYVAVTVIRDY